MKKLLILILIVTASSCVTQKRCSIKYPVKPELIIKDSIREIVTYRDTTIFVHIKGETVFKSDTIYIKEGVILNKSISAESKLATARAWIGQNRINLLLTDKDTTLTVQLSNAIKEAKYYRERFEQQTIIPEPEKYIPKFVNFLAWVGGLCIGLLLIFVLLKIKKVFS